MPNGKPLVSDLEVLKGFAEPFMICGVPRDVRMAERWGCSIKQVYRLWEKDRFTWLIEWGVSMRSGWLTMDGKVQLIRLINENEDMLHGLATLQDPQ